MGLDGRLSETTLQSQKERYAKACQLADHANMIGYFEMKHLNISECYHKITQVNKIQKRSAAILASCGR